MRSAVAPVQHRQRRRSGTAGGPDTHDRDLAAGATGPVMNLSFRDNANNETGFIVERSTDGVTFAQLGTNLPPRTNGSATVTLTDTTIAAGATARRTRTG